MSSFLVVWSPRQYRCFLSHLSSLLRHLKCGALLSLTWFSFFCGKQFLRRGHTCTPLQTSPRSYISSSAHSLPFFRTTHTHRLLFLLTSIAHIIRNNRGLLAKKETQTARRKASNKGAHTHTHTQWVSIGC